ncbi:hypothetical protein HDU92_000931, partial [Lobulomyces angularis]
FENLLSPNSKVLWTSSTSADKEKFNRDDYQAIHTRYSYESSKRLVDLIALGNSVKYNQSTPVYTTSPGCVASNILQGLIPLWLHIFVLLVMRVFFGIKEINLEKSNSCSALMYLINSDKINNQELKYLSGSSRLGKGFVYLEHIEEKERDEAVKTLNLMEELYFEQKKHLNQ